MNKGRANGRKKFDWMGGGLVTRPDSHHIEKLAKGKLFNTRTGNVDYQQLGSLQRRNGFSQVNTTVGIVDSRLSITWGVLAADYKITTDNFSTFSNASADSVTSTSANTIALCGKFTAGANGNIAFTNAQAGVSALNNTFKNIRATIRTNSGGNPGSIVTNASVAVIDGYEMNGQFPFFCFPTPVALTNGTVYWFCIQCEVTASGLTLSGNIVTNGLALFTSGTPCEGIYDYKTNDSSGVVQTPIAVEAGTIWYNNASTWTSLVSGLAANTANDLYDFYTMKNILFIADDATTKNLIWDQAQATTSTHGYRGTFTIGQSASAGGPWSAAGVVKVILVTQLISGGYRASEVKSITLGATTNKIDLTSIAVDSTAAEFGFDINALATTVYCTLPNGSIYYKVPAASLSAGGINPIANNDTAESILPTTDAALIAQGSIETNLQLPTGYFTDQVNTPKSKYLMGFQDFLVMAGDPNNLSSIWISEQYAPQIWSTFGKSYGVRLDINTDDGEVITGLQVADGALFVAKQHNLFRVDYTGDFNDPFRVRLVHGQIGCLSHFTMEPIPAGLYFLSERGPAICYGTYTKIVDQTALIQNLFSNTETYSFNLDQMRYSVAAHDTTRNQVLMTVSFNVYAVSVKTSTPVSTRNAILVYDYEQEQFFLQDGFNCNYLAIVFDGSNFPQVWMGDLSGFVYQKTSNFANAATAATSYPGSILTTWTTPDLDFGEPTYYKEGVFLEIGGETISTTNAFGGTTSTAYLAVDVYLDKSETARATLIYDMVKGTFQTGLSVAVPGKFKTIRLRFRARDMGYRGMFIHWMDFTYEVEGVRH